MSESRNVLRHHCILYNNIFKEYYPYPKKNIKKTNNGEVPNNNNNILSTLLYLYFKRFVLRMYNITNTSSGFRFFLHQVFIIFYGKN